MLVEVEYEVPPENADAFREAMERVGRSRRRAGAQRWGLFQDGSHPDKFVEVGGNSLTLNIILNRIEADTGAAIPAEMFFEDDRSSLSALAGVLEALRAAL